jgi:hypothetical protein
MPKASKSGCFRVPGLYVIWFVGRRTGLLTRVLPALSLLGVVLDIYQFSRCNLGDLLGGNRD